MKAAQAPVKPKFYPKGTLVRVRWVDSAVLSGWRAPGTVFEPGIIESIGHTVAHDAQQIVLTTSVSQDSGAVLCPLTIPMGCVEEVGEL